uniref:FAS-associated death domain protein n=1 Tax=Neogobius melanostomus TaxID=47308 RepID=A0A8C6UK46_9GOBI
MDSLSFNALLLEISDGLSAEQLERLKFLCVEDIKKREQEKCTSGHRLFQLLTERGKLGPDNTEHLCRLLSEIHLCEQMVHGSFSNKLDLAAEVLSETLGNNWRKLGRKLRLSEVKLDSISRKHPSDLEETTMELVREWRRCSKGQATVEALVQALRDCQFNMSADKVQDTLSDPALGAN